MPCFHSGDPDVTNAARFPRRQLGDGCESVVRQKLPCSRRHEDPRTLLQASQGGQVRVVVVEVGDQHGVDVLRQCPVGRRPLAAQGADPSPQHRICDEADAAQFEEHGRVADVGDAAWLRHVMHWLSGAPRIVRGARRLRRGRDGKHPDIIRAFMSRRRAILRGRLRRPGREGAGAEEEVIEIEPGELSRLFAAPGWMRDLGFSAWLLVGVAAALVGAIWLAVCDPDDRGAGHHGRDHCRGHVASGRVAEAAWDTERGGRCAGLPRDRRHRDRGWGDGSGRDREPGRQPEPKTSRGRERDRIMGSRSGGQLGHRQGRERSRERLSHRRFQGADGRPGLPGSTGWPRWWSSSHSPPSASSSCSRTRPPSDGSSSVISASRSSFLTRCWSGWPAPFAATSSASRLSPPGAH